MARSTEPLRLIEALKTSAPVMEEIFTQGSCYHLYTILKSVFKDAKALYSDIDGHWIVRVGYNYYDINGELSKTYVEGKEYKERDSITHQSAKVIKYGGPGGSYQKYKWSV